MIFTVCGYDEQEDGIALNMSEEPMAKSFAFGCTFDDAGEISHAKRFAIAVCYDAKLRCKGGEGVVCDLRFGGGDA